MFDITYIIYILVALIVLYLLIKQFKCVKYYVKWLSLTHLVIIALTIFLIVLCFNSKYNIDLIRNIACIVICIGFSLLNDGICDSGIYINFKNIQYKQINSYSIEEKDKLFTLYLNYNVIDKNNNTTVINHKLTFNSKKRNDVLSLIDKNVKKKRKKSRK